MNFDLLTPFDKAILSGCGAIKSKETCVCDRNGNTFTLNSYYDISLLMFPLYCEGNLAKLNEKLPETFDRSGNSVKFLWPDGSPINGPSSTQYSCWTMLKKFQRRGMEPNYPSSSWELRSAI